MYVSIALNVFSKYVCSFFFFHFLARRSWLGETGLIACQASVRRVVVMVWSGEGGYVEGGQPHSLLCLIAASRL